MDTGSTDHFVDSTTDVADGDWHCVIFTGDGTNIKVYVDGNTTAEDTAADTTNFNIDSAAINVGASIFDGSYITTSMDEMAIWAKELSSAEITDLWNSGAGIPYEATASAFTPKMLMF